MCLERVKRRRATGRRRLFELICFFLKVEEECEINWFSFSGCGGSEGRGDEQFLSSVCTKWDGILTINFLVERKKNIIGFSGYIGGGCCKQSSVTFEKQEKKKF